MQHMITVYLSKVGQREALLSGLSAASEQTYEVLAPDLIARVLALPWAKIDEQGNVSCDAEYLGCYDSDLDVAPDLAVRWSTVSHGYHWTPVLLDHRPATPADAVIALEQAMEVEARSIREIRQRRATERVESQQRAWDNALKWAALPLEWRASIDGVCDCVPLCSPEDYRGRLFVSGAVRYPRNELKEHVPTAYAEAEAEVERLRTEKVTKKLDAIRGVLKQYLATDATLVERFDAGVLPESEKKAYIVAELFAPLKDVPIFQQITDADFEHAENCTARDEDDTLRFGSQKLSEPELDSDEWVQLQRITELAKSIPGSCVEVREHRGHCRQCQAVFTRLGARVVTEFADDDYSKEFAL